MNNNEQRVLIDSLKSKKIKYQEIKRGKAKSWDTIIITSSNEAQSKSFELQIGIRRKKQTLPPNTKFVISPEIDGKRIGSGACILNALKKLSDKEDISKQKILIILSAGDNQRMPQSSHFGKVFTNIPKEVKKEEQSTIFDEMLIQTATIPQKMDPGVFIICGDCLSYFDSTKIDLTNKEAVSLSIPVRKELGKNHGVFVANEENIVTDFLHKQPLEILDKKAVENNKVNLDTGMTYLNMRIIEKLLKLIKTSDDFNLFISDKTCLNFYSEFLYPMTSNAKLEDYLKEKGELEINSNIIECKEKIWNVLSCYQLEIIKLSKALFFHLGTTKQYHEMVTKNLKSYSYLGWKNKINSLCSNNKEITSINSIIYKTKTKQNIYIENSIVYNCKIGENVIISNTNIKDMEIPDNVVISTVILKNKKYVTRIYDIDYNPKKKLTDNNIFKTKLPNEFLSTNYKTFWELPLYIPTSTMEESIENAFILYKIITHEATPIEKKSYLNKKRISLCYSFNNSNSSKMLKELENKKENILVQRISEMLEKRKNLNDVKNLIENASNKSKIINKLKKIENKKIDIRKYYLLSMLEKNKRNYHLNKMYGCINEYIDINTRKLPDKITTKQNVIIESHARINFAGGWSDTPPYCIENGGCVLNASITLNNEKPIKVIIEKLIEKKLVLNRVDSNEMKQITSLHDLKNYNNDTYGILKSCLLISGLIKEKDRDLNELFNRINSGLKISTDTTNIPEGSGLGTSSILAATILQAIYKFINVHITNLEISHQVLKIEQMIGTGGGWQDQIGGIFPGIKLIQTEKGLLQDFKIHNINSLNCTKNELNNRLLLINTKIRRKSKKHLKTIMEKYIEGDLTTIKILKEIKVIALSMSNDLEEGNIDSFVNKLNYHWKLSKELDPSCTNHYIDNIVNNIKDLIDGKIICGAGGGGFLLIVLKKNIEKIDIDKRIKEKELKASSFSIKIE